MPRVGKDDQVKIFVYMMRRRWDYFVRYLKGAEPPKEYELKPVQDKRAGN